MGEGEGRAVLPAPVLRAQEAQTSPGLAVKRDGFEPPHMYDLCFILNLPVTCQQPVTVSLHVHEHEMGFYISGARRNCPEDCRRAIL
ncbi:hypothetical protein ES703_69453 [subsurface metagenome]